MLEQTSQTTNHENPYWRQLVSQTVTPIIEAYQRNETPTMIKHADHAGRLKLNSLADLALADPRINNDIQARHELPRGFPSRWLVKKYIGQILITQGAFESGEATYRIPEVALCCD